MHQPAITVDIDYLDIMRVLSAVSELVVIEIGTIPSVWMLFII